MAGFKKQSTQDLNEQKLLRAQLHIQNNLDGDLSLRSVATYAGASASYFHRLFKARLGETIKEYVDRLRVEKSLYDIRISDLNLFQIALRYGFKNPETFSRVFKRHFGQPPSYFLKQRLTGKRDSASYSGDLPPFEVGLRCSKASNFSVTRLSTLHLAFIRHIGPYEKVPLIAAKGRTLWRELEEFADDDVRAAGPYIYVGVPQDNPHTTVPEKQRFDACLIVDQPFHAQGRIGYQTIREGYYGALTHAGPYSTLAHAYQSLFQLSKALPGFRIAPRPAFEVLLTISATSIDEHTWTELYLPLEQGGAML